MVLVILVAADIGILPRPTAQLALGLVPLLAIFLRSRCDRSYATARLYFVIVGSLLLPMASSFALIGQQLTVYHVKTFDIPAYLVDNSYGFSASATLGELTWAHAALHQVIGIIYGWLPAAISTCYALNVRAGNRDAGNSAKSGACGRRDSLRPLPFLSGRGTDLRVWPGFPCIVAGPRDPSVDPGGIGDAWRRAQLHALGALRLGDTGGSGGPRLRQSVASELRPIRHIDRLRDDRSWRALRHRLGCRCSVHFVRASSLQQRAILADRLARDSGFRGSRDIELAVVFADMDTPASCFLRALVGDPTHHCRERAPEPRPPLQLAGLMAETRLFRL